MLPKSSPYAHLLEEDETFRRWYENAERGSVTYARVCFRRIGNVCREYGIKPADLASKNPKEVTSFLLDVVSMLEARGNAGSLIESYLKAIKSWLTFNDIVVTKKIRIPYTPNRYENERTPSQEELNRILDHADIRAKVAASLIAFSGIRPEVMGNYYATDGLRLGDLPDLEFKGEKTVSFSKVPCKLVVRRPISKSKRSYFTFVPGQGCEYIREYLEARMRAGEKLTQESAVVTVSKFNVQEEVERYNKKLYGQHLSTTKLSQLLRLAIRAAGFGWRPYVLRRYFDVRLMMAEADGLLIEDWRVFWMGHVGDIEHTYTVNKGLTGDAAEKMREAYAKASERHLITTSGRQSVTKDQVMEMFNKQFLTVAGYNEGEIEKLGDLSAVTSERLQELMKRKSLESIGFGNGSSQKVVALSEVPTWIEKGFEYVTSIPPDRAIVRVPKG